VVKDICIIRARAVGTKDGKPSEAVVEVIDYYDDATGFSSMQRTTGWHLSIVAAMMARGETPIGSIPLEIAVADDAFVREARRRGFRISEKVVAV
jgi:lysine 6-dehydrogenase